MHLRGFLFVRNCDGLLLSMVQGFFLLVGSMAVLSGCGAACLVYIMLLRRSVEALLFEACPSVERRVDVFLGLSGHSNTSLSSGYNRGFVES